LLLEVYITSVLRQQQVQTHITFILEHDRPVDLQKERKKGEKTSLQLGQVLAG
jgi:hypothetical protein